MASALIIGDGPAGLSAALFLARAGHEVTVFGTDGSAMHYAHLHNYLGIPEVGGTAFQQVARQQVSDAGARLDERQVTSITRDGDRFTAAVEGDPAAATGDYVVLAAGKTAGPLAEALGVQVTAEGVDTDRDGHTAVDRVYVVGRLAKPGRSQAIISAGIGAAAALDIVAREAGHDVTDWESPPE
jgi:thioredoxin reductase (NADPH)